MPGSPTTITEAGLTRRQTLLVGTGMLLLPQRQAFAQANVDLMRPAFEGAVRVRAFVLEVPLGEVDPFVIRYLDIDYVERRSALNLARKSEIFTNTTSAFNYVDRIPAIVPPGFPFDLGPAALESQKGVIALVAQSNLPLAPELRDLAPEIIATTPPTERRTDANVIIVCDILLETLGISIGETSLIEEIIASSPQLKEKADALVKSISSKEWTSVLLLGEEAFRLFVAGSIWDKIRKQMGRKIAFGLALRCVPLVGWAYVGVAFLFSVKKNYHRFFFA